MKKSTLVFAGSTALVEYSRRFGAKEVHLVPTALEMPSGNSVSGKAEQPVTIGWIGITSNMLYLELVDEAALQLQKRHPEVVFTLMSGMPPENLKAAWQFFPWSSEAESLWLQSLDIGIMPLTDDEWSRGKCAFKLLQYMSRGKPVIASAVGANIDAVRHGESGYLVSSSQEWAEALENLVSDRAKRLSMGQEGMTLFLADFERKVVQNRIARLLQEHA